MLGLIAAIYHMAWASIHSGVKICKFHCGEWCRVEDPRVTSSFGWQVSLLYQSIGWLQSFKSLERSGWYEVSGRCRGATSKTTTGLKSKQAHIVSA